MKKIHPLQLGDTHLELHVWEKNSPHDTTLINLHENETTSIEAGIEFINLHGGRFSYLHHDGSRNIQFKLYNETLEIDPNRIFSYEGIFKSFCNLNPRAEHTLTACKTIEGFAHKLRELLLPHTFTPQTPLIALHNNQGDGEYTIKSLTTDPSIEKVHMGTTHSIYDFFYVLDAHHFEQLSRQGYHVALQKTYQDIPKTDHDGSMSLYLGEHQQCYINIEAKMGNLVEQLDMLEQTQLLSPIINPW